MKIIEVGIHDKFDGYTSEKHQWVIDNFKMPIPNKVRLHICDSTLQKMKEAVALTNAHKFHEIGFLSTTRQDPENCRVELFLDEHLIEIAEHEDFDRYFYSFDNEHFRVKCDSFYPDSFQAKFLYHNGTGREFSFKSKHFKI